MKKIIIVFTAAFCIGNQCFAQELCAGLRTGFKIENFNIPLGKHPFKKNYYYQERRVLVSPMDVSAPTAEALFRVTFPKNWEVEASIGWYNYSQKLKARISAGCAANTFGVQNATDYTFSTPNEQTFGSVFLSPKVSYRFAVARNLYFRPSTGVQVGWLYNVRSTSNTLVESEPFELQILYSGLGKIPINVHISNALNLQYVTKYDFYFSIFAAYHVGLFNTYQSDVYLTNRKSNEAPFYDGHDTYMHAAVNPKGSYFGFGIELGYIWHKRNNVKL